jgi:hypothetical protein
MGPPTPRSGVPSIVIGVVAALACMTVPFARFVFHPLVTVLHELGHVVADWAFGRPAIPAFDFVHGGGMTVSQGRSWILLALLGGAWIAAAVAVRTRPRAVVAVASAAAVWAVLLASGADELVILVCGHAFELMFVVLFAARAISGNGVRGAADRAAYAFAATFVWSTNLALAWGLAFRHEARVEYELAKGGGAWMDLSRIAREFAGLSLESVAGFYLIVVLLVPVAVRFVDRIRAAARSAVDRVLSVPRAGAGEAVLSSEDAAT